MYVEIVENRVRVLPYIRPDLGMYVSQDGYKDTFSVEYHALFTMCKSDKRNMR